MYDGNILIPLYVLGNGLSIRQEKVRAILLFYRTKTKIVRKA